MKELRCFECGNKRTNYIFRKSKRLYEGEGFNFELEVETPYCEKCDAPLYDRELEQEIRKKAHNKFLRCKWGFNYGNGDIKG